MAEILFTIYLRACIMVRSLVKAKVNTGTCKIKKVKKAEKKKI